MTTAGSCLCGDIAFHFTGTPDATALCHCLDCQKWTGGAFTSNAVVPRTAFSLTKGTPKAYDVTGDSGKTNRHFFCPRCGSSLYTELDLLPDKTVVKAGSLDAGAARLDGAVAVEFYTKDRVPYLRACDDAKQESAFGS
ncbi:hypothetical protein CDD83_10037 [Cordyceps sp. RAO-2017]|nr:hypothetical protein CDD83_10037 [Cordyceps sp. RAO-2017]